MILSTLFTSQLHFEMCAGLYGHPVNPVCDLDQTCVALRHFYRIVCFLCPLAVLSDGFHKASFWFLQCIVYCSHGME